MNRYGNGAPTCARRATGRATGTLSVARVATVMMLAAGFATAMLLAAMTARAERLPRGYWSEKQSAKVLAKTVEIRLDPDISYLSPVELEVIDSLVAVGTSLQRLYETSRHPQALESYRRLKELDDKLGLQATHNLLDLYRLFKGPIGRDLSGKLRPFLPVDVRSPGRNVYPWQVTREEVDGFLERHPEKRASLLHLRRVVRRATRANLRSDIAILSGSDVLRTLHPGLERELDRELDETSGEGFYSLPYSVAYAEQLVPIYFQLRRIAARIEETDIDFARYLRHRALDLLTDDYEAGDAAWVTGRFRNINVQIGSYETYDDQLYGVKSFFGASVLVKDRAMSSSLGTAVQWTQELEDLLPYETHKKVRTDIPIGIYNVIADFGQARGTNTASILPNESYITRKYGRTILIRHNILDNPDIFQMRKRAFGAAVAGKFHEQYKARGDFFRTMWHEVGHYLGVDQTEDGRTLDIALEEDSAILEELKADLVSLFVSKNLFKRRYYSVPTMRAVQTSGVRRVLRKNQPRKSQVYATMELMQMNYFLENGLLEYDRRKKELVIRYDRYHPTVEAMLRDVLALQYAGDKAAADRFINKYSTWDDKLHGTIARAMKKAEKYRYAIVRYAALGE